MTSADQVIEGVKTSTGIDIKSVLAGIVGGKIAAAATPQAEAAVTDATLRTEE
jgi:hypothetical protein